MEDLVKKIKRADLPFEDKKRIFEIFGIKLVERTRRGSSVFNVHVNDNGVSNFLLLDLYSSGWGGLDPSGAYDFFGDVAIGLVIDFATAFNCL